MTDIERAHVAEPNEWWHAFLDSIDEVQTADVKPATEPDWTTALVVRDRDGDYWSTQSMAQASRSTDRLYGPLTIVIDADGNNVEAADMQCQIDCLTADIIGIESARGKEIAKLDAKIGELRGDLNEAVRSRETALRELRKTQRMLSELWDEAAEDKHEIRVLLSRLDRLETENARLQAQSGDGH